VSRHLCEAWPVTLDEQLRPDVLPAPRVALGKYGAGLDARGYVRREGSGRRFGATATLDTVDAGLHDLAAGWRHPGLGFDMLNHCVLRVPFHRGARRRPLNLTMSADCSVSVTTTLADGGFVLSFTQ